MGIGSSSRLTLFHDGQFWVGLFESADEDGYSVCRVTFGAEPSDEEVLSFVCTRWSTLAFSRPSAEATPPKPPASNPKRRQREVAKALSEPAVSTKAQAALSAQREGLKADAKSASRERREEERERRFCLRQQKRKQRKRGR
ncbi:MAG: YjdF family protein [Atopobiaceae bacterium]|jgi:hypothetical protein|nr:YjdF family protein [Atopobiaceae bacterium]